MMDEDIKQKGTAGLESKGGRHRSPNYPMFDLSAALGKAGRFYNELKRNIVDVDTAMQAIGYKPKTAGGGRGIATMLGYGLLDEMKGSQGGRQFKLSQTAYRLVVVLSNDESEHIDLLRDAALKPKIYRDIVQRFPDSLPNDAAIRKVLLDDMNFNPEVVADVIKDFRATYDFARLTDRGMLSEGDSDRGDTDDNEEEEEKPLNPGINRLSAVKPSSGGSTRSKTMQGTQIMTRTFAIPMENSREILLQAPETLEKADVPYLKLLKSYIDLMLARLGIDPDNDQNQDRNHD